MTKDTKRVHELEVGDVVIFPYCKGISIISKIEKISKWEYEIFSEHIRDSGIYGEYVEVTYLGNNNEEETED